jgi:potassium channel subfamily V protein 1
MNFLKRRLNYVKTRVSPVDEDILIKSEPSFNRQTTELKLEEKKDPNSRKRIVLNARGTRFEVFARILEKYPETRLGKLKILLEEITFFNKVNPDFLLDLCDDYDLDKNEFFFDQNPLVLESVLSYFKDGQLHYPNNLCVKLFENGLNYWGLDEWTVDDCCQVNYTTRKEAYEDEIEAKKKILVELYHKEDFSKYLLWTIPSKRLVVWREKTWHVLDKPLESYIGMVYIQINV